MAAAGYGCPGGGFPVRGCHPLWPAFPGASGTNQDGHWPVPRSLATTDGISRRRLSPPPSAAARATPVLMSVPPATEMFQFAGFASCTYQFSTGYPGSSPGWVAPFGDPGITDRSHLPRAFRSVPRPSSPLSAKASTRCPCLALDHRIAVAGDANHRRAQSQAPCFAPATTGADGLYEDTSLGPARSKPCSPGRSASVTSQLSLHPSINPTAKARGGVRDLLRTSGRASGRPARRACNRLPASTSRLPGKHLVPATPGGGERIRTDDLLLAKQALSQLSYTPAQNSVISGQSSEILITVF